MDKKKFIIIISVVMVCLVVTGLYGTLATSSTVSGGDNTYTITLAGNSGEVVVPAGSSKTVIYQVTNTNKGIVNYGIAYAGENITVKIYDDSLDSETDLIDYGETKFIKLIVINSGDTDSTASIKPVLGYENGGSLNVSNIVPSGYTFVTETYVNSNGGSGSDTSNNTLIDHITNLYTSGNPTLITQEESNDTYYYSYQDTNKTWGLMNDGLKVDTTQDETTTGLAVEVTDTTKLTSGTEGNIRYFGPSDSVNNYIYFNCSDYSNQSDSTCEKWRIIGIVDGKVKIIRDSSIGEYAWDYNSDETYDNNWSDATLKKLLNDAYYNSGSTTYYNGSATGTSVTFASNGITEATRNNNLISTSTWYLGGYSALELYSNEIYAYERTNKEGTTIYSGNPFSITANIGLMYASDYGYATDLSKCSDYLSAYNSSTDDYACRTNNWLFNSSLIPWLITPLSSTSSTALVVMPDGYIYNSVSILSPIHVLPVLYLNPELGINSEGDGSSGNPYQLYVKEEEDNVEDKTTIIDYITNLYTSGNPALITQYDTDGNSVNDYYYSYQDTEQTWGLMNDGLKIDTTQDETTTGLATTVTDTTKLTSGTEGNIRYFGPSDSVNNYIYFNCETYPDTNCELWRIIGIVDGKVKIIRNDNIGSLAWDYGKNQDSSSTTYFNNWETSSLQLMLNSSYYNGDTAGTITYYSGDDSSGEISTSLNMSNIGIKNDITRGMISESIWYLGSEMVADSKFYPGQIYTGERKNIEGSNDDGVYTEGVTRFSGNPFTISANIGLIYVSDYGYATNLSKCSDNIVYYNSYDCYSNDWLFNSTDQYFISPSPFSSNFVWNGYSDGQVGMYNTYYALGVRPVLHLNSELSIESEGDGTSANPYRISVS